jgi:ketosteroid isomerase-like protein
MAHPNEELVRSGFDAFSKGDVDTLRDLFDPDAVWHSPGRSPLSGDHRGVDDILDFFARTMELTASTFRVELHDVVANDEQERARQPCPQRQVRRDPAALRGSVRGRRVPLVVV